MQGSNVRNNLFPNGNVELKSVSSNNNITQNGLKEKNFMNGLQNARNILTSLERSLRKSSKYESQLLQCKAAHSQRTHSVNEWWSDDVSEEKHSKCSKTEAEDVYDENSNTNRANNSQNIQPDHLELSSSAYYTEEQEHLVVSNNRDCSGTTKSARSQVDLGESWATMSIVCLQYQYEELTKRYESLLQLYDERCSSLSCRDAALARLRQRARMTHARLAHAHKTLLTIGDKYLALREKRLAQKIRYEEELERLRATVSDVMSVAERARLDLDTQIAHTMETESDAATSLLLAEIRKCNLLFLENLRLKAQIEELAPGKVKWEN